MRQTLSWIIILTTISSAVVIGLIQSKGRRALPRLPSSATLVFSEDFEDANALSHFTHGAPDLGHQSGTKDIPAWRIVDGALYAENAHNAALWLQKKLPSGDLRISFSASALTDDGDLKCEILGDGINHQSGYILINGGWKNSIRAIARQDEHGEDRHNDHHCTKSPQRKCVVPQIEQTWVIERRGDRIDWYIDGIFTLSYADAHPIKGRYFGFNNWSAKTRFDHLKIYDLSSE